MTQQDFWAGSASGVQSNFFFRCLFGAALFAMGFATVAAHAQSSREFRAHRIMHIPVEDAAQRLRSMLSQAGNSIEVFADKEQARLLVQGDEPTQSLATQFLQAIDQPVRTAPALPNSPPPKSEVRGYPVAPANLQSLTEQLRQRFTSTPGIRVAADPRVGQIIVVAPPEIQKQVDQFLNSNSTASPGSPATHRMPAVSNPPIQQESVAPLPGYRLRHATWQELEAGLQRVSGGRLTVSATNGGEISTLSLQNESGVQQILQLNRPHREVTFAGDPATVQVWRRAVEALDHPKSSPESQVGVAAVRNADPARVRLAVAAMQSNAGSSGAASAVKPRPKWGGRLVSRIFQDTTEAGAESGADDAGAGEEATDSSEGGGLIGNVELEYLDGLDAIIIRGRPSDVAVVRKLIDDIERLSLETQPVVDIYHLQHINGSAAADLVTELYEEILSPRQGQVSIRALVDPNAILLIGREESVDVVKNLISKLDQPFAPASQFEVFRLKSIAANDAELTIRNFFVARPELDTEERGGLGTRVRVLADYRSNSLIVQASPRDLAEVRRLIANIDVDTTENLAELRVFRLRNALADDLAEVLQTAISGPTAATVGGQAGGQGANQTQASLPSATLQFLLVEDGGMRRMLRSGILSDAQVTSDPSINALLVRAPADSMELFEALIGHLDQLPNAEAKIKVFEMQNGDATSLAGMLQQLFGQQVTVGQGNAQFALGGFGGQNQQQLQGATAGGESSLVPLRIAVDVRTNSIIVSASASDMDVVETLLLRLDLDDVETRSLKVVRLQNAPALDVANAITSFLTSQRQLIQQQLIFNQAISPYEQIEREVIVVAEPVSNSLIVSATPRYYDQILKVIQDLDFRPKMVMVQVVIAEIVLSDEFQFGVEVGLQDELLFDRGLVLNAMSPTGNNSVPGFNFNDVANPLPNLNTFGRDVLAGQTLTNFGVGRTNGGLVLSAASESINILVRALQEQGQAQVLARPQIMTLHNQIAIVQVGQTISRITGTNITGNGIVQNVISDVETGLILEVHPLINDDGVVVMSVRAERSRLGNEAEGTVVAIDQNGQPIRSAPIDRTTAETIVNARSGQTVVFAGLITSDKRVALRRVPWISDIPVIGRLFEYEDSLDRRTELMIIMTPHIVETDEDYEWIKAVESERMSWCLADLVNLHGNVGLQGNNPLFCCDNLPVIYPHIDPIGIEGTGMPMETLAPPIDFSERDGPLFQHSPVVTEAVLNPQPAGNDNAMALPVAPGYQSTVTYGPPPAGYSMPSFQQPRIDGRAQEQRTANQYNYPPQTPRR